MDAASSRTVVRGGYLFDGTGAPVARGDIVMQGGRITDVGLDLDGDREVDATGLTILPGLFDCHVHTTLASPNALAQLGQPFSYQFYVAARNLAAALDCGVTTVRDAAGADLGIKQAVDDGLVDGPRLQIAITMMSQTGGHGDGWMASGACAGLFPPHAGRPDGVVDGTDEIRRKVREVLRSGADVIKVCASGGVLSPRDDPRHPHLREDELTALVQEAAFAETGVMAHATAAAGVKNAVRAGVRSIEHGLQLDDEAITMMLDAGTWLVPTLSALPSLLEAVDAGLALPAAQVAKAREACGAQRESFRRAVAAGVRVAMGTDSGVGPFGAHLRELQLMRECGMAPEQALLSATSSAAELMGVEDELGTLTPGRRADLVLVDGDVLDFTALKETIRSVYKDGELVRDTVAVRDAGTPGVPRTQRAGDTT